MEMLRKSISVTLRFEMLQNHDPESVTIAPAEMLQIRAGKFVTFPLKCYRIVRNIL